MNLKHNIHARLKFGSLAGALLIIMLIFSQCTDDMSGLTGSTSGADDFISSTTTFPGKTTLPGGALYEISLPEGDWKDLVIYAHGYVNPGDPLQIPKDTVRLSSEIPVYVPVAQIINELGFAYATTSYRDNGLVIPDAIKDILFLRKRFVQQYGEPDHIYLVGPSEGGAVTTLAMENYPRLFDAGFATCGPIGDFRDQLNYLGDFHVLFNYFFPNINIGDPSGVPESVINDWVSGPLQSIVTNAILSDPVTTTKLLTVAQVPVDPTDPASVIDTILEVLRYNVLATNDGIEKLNGRPFDNIGKIYFGTGSAQEDWQLNQQVLRFSADAKALHAIERDYQTTGNLGNTLVTMHTIYDNIVPFWHEVQYRNKVLATGSTFNHIIIPILRYGHCNFTVDQVLAGFAIMVQKTTSQELEIPSSLVAGESEQQIMDLSRSHGANPKIIHKPELIQ